MTTNNKVAQYTLKLKIAIKYHLSRGQVALSFVTSFILLV